MIPQFEDATRYARERLHKFANGNKRKVNLSMIRRPGEEHLLKIEVIWKRFCERYYSDTEFEMKVDWYTFWFSGFCLGIILGVMLAMIYGVLTQ